MSAVEEHAQRHHRGDWKPFAGETAQLFPLNSTSPQLEDRRRVKSGAGMLFGFSVYSTIAQNIQVFDLQNVTNLSTGVVPVMNFPVQALQTITVGFTEPWRSFNQGILVANSSTDTSYTQGLKNCIFDVQYA